MLQELVIKQFKGKGLFLLLLLTNTVTNTKTNNHLILKQRLSLAFMQKVQFKILEQRR